MNTLADFCTTSDICSARLLESGLKALEESPWPGNIRQLQLDRLYQRVIDDLDKLTATVGLKAA